MWNDSGGFVRGGVSAFFARPDWQLQAKVPPREDGKTGRAIPDVSANASPDGYRVYIHGQQRQVGGTTASGSLWAGLIALINQGVGRNVGYINPLLYSKLGPEGILRDITEGTNDIGTASKGLARPWVGCMYGLGQPERPETLRGVPIALYLGGRETSKSLKERGPEISGKS